MERFKSYPHFSDSSGFTLIEVLIAITILSFIAFSTYKMVDSNTTTKETVLREDQVIIQSLTAIARLDSDLSQLYTPLYYSGKSTPQASASADVYAEEAAPSGNFDGKSKNGQLIPQFKSEEKSSIIFFTQANRRKVADSKESRFAWVKYSLRPMENDPDAPEDEKRNQGSYEFVRQVIATDIFNPALSWTEVKPQVLLKNVKSVEFSFWDERTKKFVTSIQELNENKNLIRALKVVLVWIDEDNNEQTVEKAFRIMHPYFNTKQDDLKLGTSGAGSGAGIPGNTPPPLPPGDDDDAK